jgi:RNA-directed DNA polymerase
LKAEVKLANGTIEERTKGTPQGGVISPLLANIFLHFAFDKWMEKKYSNIPFERDADDIIVHCKTEKQAEYIRGKIKKRLEECKLELNPDKTKIVYCKNANRRGDYPNVTFDFFG